MGQTIHQDGICGAVRTSGVGSLGLLCNNQHKYRKPQLPSLDANSFRNLATYISFSTWAHQQKFQLEFPDILYFSRLSSRFSNFMLPLILPWFPWFSRLIHLSIYSFASLSFPKVPFVDFVYFMFPIYFHFRVFLH